MGLFVSIFINEFACQFGPSKRWYQNKIKFEKFIMGNTSEDDGQKEQKHNAEPLDQNESKQAWKKKHRKEAGLCMETKSWPGCWDSPPQRFPSEKACSGQTL